MDIRTNVDGLKTLLGVPSTPASQSQAVRKDAPSPADSLETDRATLSSAGSSVAQAASESDVRSAKVAAVQASLAAGTYDVPASAVASRVVESMLGRGDSIEN